MKNLETLVKNWGSLNLVWPDHASASASLGRVPTPKERNFWRNLVRKTYGTPALKAGYAIFGRALTLEDLAQIAKDPEPWIARAEEGKGLAPLLAMFVKAKQPAPANFKRLRDSTLERGLSSVGWKWLCRQNPKTVAKLFAFGWTHEAMWWANLLSKAVPVHALDPLWVESGRAYLQQSLYECVKQTESAEGKNMLTLQVERLFRLVPEKANAQTMFEYELISYAFLAGVRAPELQISVAPGRNWRSLLGRVRKQNDKRAAIALELARVNTETAKCSTGAQSWSQRIGSGVLDNIQVQELTHVKDLETEGAIMTHCVGDGGYLVGCIVGTHAVFSLLEPLSRTRATLQLMHDGGSNRWRIGQLAGPANTAVPQIFWKVSRALANGDRPRPIAATTPSLTA